MPRKLAVGGVLLALAFPSATGAHNGEKHKSVGEAIDHAGLVTGPEVVSVKDPKASSHAAATCAWWANADPAHPDAPGSYSSYNCEGLGGNYVRVNGRGKYSGQLHHSLVHCWHIWLDGMNWHACNSDSHWHG
jgi:hypothetical protein